MDMPKDGRFTPQDAELIRHKVRRLVGRCGFGRADDEDLRQELAMHVAQRIDRYDPKRGARSTFVDRIVRHKIAHIVEHRIAKKRDRRREQPLEGCLFQPLECDRDLHMDVQDAVALLPDDLRAIATLFMKFSEAEVIRETGLSRERVRRLSRRIARRLTDLGIGSDFLD